MTSSADAGASMTGLWLTWTPLASGLKLTIALWNKFDKNLVQRLIAPKVRLTNFMTNFMKLELKCFCSNDLPSARVRWVRSTFLSHCPLHYNQCHRLTIATSIIFQLIFLGMLGIEPEAAWWEASMLPSSDTFPPPWLLFDRRPNNQWNSSRASLLTLIQHTAGRAQWWREHNRVIADRSWSSYLQITNSNIELGN